MRWRALEKTIPCHAKQHNLIDDTSARATLTDGLTTVMLEFRFGIDGLIEEVRAASRSRSPTESAPWLCRISGYEQRAGMHVPIQGEVEWQLPSGPAPYFCGRMSHLEYEFAGR